MSSSSTVNPRKGIRRRSSSVTNALKQIPLNQEARQSPSISEVQPLAGRPRPKKQDINALPELYKSEGFLKDLKTGKWMLIPSSALMLYLVPVVLYFNHALLVQYGLLAPATPNPFAKLVLPSGRLDNGTYTKSIWDFTFLATYVIFWSFVRQFVTIHILRPLAISLGIKGGKIMRFTERYKTEHFWLEYPHKQMTFELKTYYLMQAAYWLQQTIILAAKIEKPRKDFKELVAHHLVTLWLIGWSYNVYLAKCVNYVSEAASPPFFAFFVAVWSYFRHYLNIWILWSVWAEFKLIPEKERQRFAPLEDKWLDWWMQWQIFAPIFLLQLINLFWYFLIWRILLKAVFSKGLSDERSDDEDEGEIEGEQNTGDKLKAQ